MKNLYRLILLVMLSLPWALNAQEVINLESTVSGNQTYTASEAVYMKPGFSYKASTGQKMLANIDQTGVFPPTGNTYAKPDGSITNNPLDGAVVGNLSGNFNVSPTGAATYSVPIECLPGINGMQPNISLEYNSQGGNGIVGMCWNIGGLSMISRTGKNYYYDNEKSGIIWDKTSPLVLDGQRLVKIQEWGTDSIEYRIESGLDRIVAYEIGGWGPLYFKVYTKSGNVIQYGDERKPNSYFPLKACLSRGFARKDLEMKNLGWAITSITDKNENFVLFEYASDQSTEDNDGPLPDSYYYNGTRVSSISYGSSYPRASITVGTIKLEYINHISPHITYLDGFLMSNNYILDKINVSIPDGRDFETIYTYDLSYDVRENNYFLQDIKKSNSAGEFIHPLKFEWSPMSYNYSHLYPLYVSGYDLPPEEDRENFYVLAQGDIDGDGLMDIVVGCQLKDEKGNHEWIVYKNKGNGYFSYLYSNRWRPKTEKTFLFLDLNHDGIDELYMGRVAINFGVPSYCLDAYTASGFDLAKSLVFEISEDKMYDYQYGKIPLNIIPGNFTGNTTPDFFLMTSKNKFIPNKEMGILSFPFGGKQYTKIFLTDINGNGKTEIAYRKDDRKTIVFYELEGNKFVEIYSMKMSDKADDFFVGDFNGDGYTDILVKTYSLTKWKIYYFTGREHIEKNISNTISDVYLNVYAEDICILDINKDGKSDILIKEPHKENTWDDAWTDYNLKLLISTGDDFNTEMLATKISSFYTFMAVGDFMNGDGNGLDIFSDYASSPDILSLSKNVWFNKIIKITDSVGNNLNISYQKNQGKAGTQSANLTSSTENGAETFQISRKFIPQLEITKSVKSDLANQTFTFRNPETHYKSGRGLLGFAYIQTIDKLNLIESVSEYKKYETVLYPRKTTIKTSSGGAISEQLSSYTIENLGNKRFYLRQDSVYATDYLAGTTSKKYYKSYDAIKNPLQIITDVGDGIKQIENFTYTAGNHWCANKIKSHEIKYQAPGETEIVRKSEFTYDNKDNLLTETVDKGTTFETTTLYGNYDRFGNPGIVTVKANNEQRSNTYTYTDCGRFVKSKTNHLGETLTYAYDETKGLLKSETSRIGTTKYEYDGFGSLKQTIYPDGVKTVQTLQWAGNIADKPAGAKYYSYSQTSGESPLITWYNGLGQELRSESYGLNKKKIWVDTKYDAKERVSDVSEPYFPGGNIIWAAKYKYDSYGRQSSVTTPMGTTQYTYNKLTTTITAPTGKKENTTNAAGWLVSEKTDGKEVLFKHYADGSVKSATPEGGQSIVMTYDLQGNRTQIIDPDAGTITSVYDAWGQLIKETQSIHLSGNPITTNYTYLPNGLLKQKKRGREITNYGYDNQNRLTTISISGKHAQTISYDQYDRVVQIQDVVENGKTFAHKTEYDRLGRVYKDIYPGGYETFNYYDSYGYFTSVKDKNDVVLWNGLESNARGQLTKTQIGGKETNYTYNNKSFLTGIHTPGINHWEYTYDNKGNMLSRYDKLINKREVFAYDNLKRLTGNTIYNGSGNSILTAESIDYDPVTGNMIDKTDFAYDMEYKNGTHALASFVPNTMDNLYSDQQITYTDFKKVNRIVDGDNSLDIAYGVDEQRIKSTLITQGRNLTRYYLGNYEEEVDPRTGAVRKINYISGGDGLAAIYVQNNGNDTLYYAHTDFQGNLVALSHPDGKIAERYAYDAWGNRRNPTTWTSADTRTNFIIHRGYTLHEHLSEFGLINMNGRIYDPQAGMFLSPDPYVQAPGDWLNYNRYGYCLFNPLSYTDPSGELWWLIPAAVGFVTNYVSSGLQSGDWGWSSIASGVFGAGAAVLGYHMMGGVAAMSGWQFAGYNTANSLISSVLPSMNIPLGGGFGLSISPALGLGTGGFTGGMMFSGYYSNGDFSIGAGIGAGNNYWGWNASATYKGYGGGYGQTSYKASEVMGQKLGAQKVGTYTAFFNHNSFSISNDLWGDKQDRWRTSAVEMTIGKWSVGTYLYTNDGRNASGEEMDPSDNCIPPRPVGIKKSGERETWTNGRPYYAPFWVGYRKGNQVTRMGFSHEVVHNLTQNMVHKYMSTPYYMSYDEFRRGGYFYTGYRNPLSLWNH